MPAYVYRDEGGSSTFTSPVSALQEPEIFVPIRIFDPLIQRLLDALNDRTQWEWSRSSWFDVMTTLTVNDIDIVYVHRTLLLHLDASVESYVMNVIDDACRYVGQILIMRK